MVSDKGECNFNVDMNAGTVAITIRQPLTIDKRTMTIPISELLEITAQITLEWLSVARQLNTKILETANKSPKGA